LRRRENRGFLRQFIVVARNLRKHRGHGGGQLEVPVLYKVTAHAAEVDRGEEVLEIEIKNPSALPVLRGVRND